MGQRKEPWLVWFGPPPLPAPGIPSAGLHDGQFLLHLQPVLGPSELHVVETLQASMASGVPSMHLSMQRGDKDALH
jgi:hypothetical protein